MGLLIRVHEVSGSHSTSIETNEVLLNENRIVTVMHAYETDLGNTRILLQTGKTMYVEESLNEIEDLVNDHHRGKGGLFSRPD